MSNFGEAVSRMRKACGYSQNDLAERSRISRSRISELETGSRGAPRDVEIPIAISQVVGGPERYRMKGPLVELLKARAVDLKKVTIAINNHVEAERFAEIEAEAVLDHLFEEAKQQ